MPTFIRNFLIIFIVLASAAAADSTLVERKEFSVKTPQGWKADRASSSSSASFWHPQRGWKFKISNQKRPLPSRQSEERIRTTRQNTVTKVKNTSLQGRKGYILEWTRESRGQTKALREGYFTGRGSNHFRLTMTCLGSDFGPSEKDWKRFLQGVKFSDSKSSGKKKKKQPSVVEEANFTVHLAPNWSVDGDFRADRNRIKLVYAIHGARAGMTVNHEDFPPVSLAKVVKSPHKLIDRGKARVGNRNGIYGSSYYQDRRHHFYYVDNGRGGRFRLHFQCNKSDYPKVKKGLQQALKGLEFF